ncbi:MAG: hypothetical protein ACLFV3_06835 [Phycisphaeraceae bacterium]
MKPESRALFVCMVLAVMAVFGCQERPSRSVVVSIRPDVDKPGGMAISMSPENDVVIDQSSRTSEVRFPSELAVLGEVFDGLEFTGLMAKGDGDRVVVMKADTLDSHGRLQILVDSTVPIRIEVEFGPELALERGEIEVPLVPGDYRLWVAPDGRVDIQPGQEAVSDMLRIEPPDPG